MRVALFTGGLPRFTSDFVSLMNQLQGFDSADIYMTFWKTDWADSNNLARLKVERILHPRYRLAKINIVDEPIINFPPHRLNHPPVQHDNLRWFYHRRRAQFWSLKLAYDLIDQDYDYLIRFRVDGQLTQIIDLQNYNLKTDNIIIPRNGCGYPQWPINDQFAIGTYQSLSFYKTIADNFDKLMMESDPDWELNQHGRWAGEHLIAHYLNTNNVKYKLGNFDHILTTRGRSKYTDKHYHLPITQDITE